MLNKIIKQPGVLVNTLQKYPQITGNPGIKIVITGGRPQPKDFKNYPSYLFFDGDR